MKTPGFLAGIDLAAAGLALLLTLPGAAHAQAPAGAGSLQQQIERERKSVLPSQAEPEPLTEPAAIQAQDKVKVTVSGFHFAGNTLLNDETLAAALVGYLNRPLAFAELQQAAASVDDAYRAAGWIVRVYLPAQDLGAGSVTIQIIEAVFGGTFYDGVEPGRLKPAYILALFEAQQKVGEVPRSAKLDRALLLAGDLPGVAVSGHLRKGIVDNATELVVTLTDKPLLTGDVALDNTGDRATGRNRLSVNLKLASPLGLGDLLSTNLMEAQGGNSVHLGYSAPVGVDGWRVAANANQLHYRLVVSSLNSSTDNGSSGLLGVEASYPLIRARRRNLYLNLSYDHKALDNRFASATVNRYQIDNLTLALKGDLLDKFGGGGTNNASLRLISGALTNEIGLSDQHFNKLFYSIDRLQVLTESLSLFAALSGQQARTNLDFEERFYLGGGAGVRAYPSSEGNGSSGQLVNLELRWRLAQGFTLTGFYDYGRISNYDASPSYSLRGGGAALVWQANSKLNLRAVWARRSGDNPSPAPNGNDQDGSLDKNRWWLIGSLTF